MTEIDAQLAEDVEEAWRSEAGEPSLLDDVLDEIGSRQLEPEGGTPDADDGLAFDEPDDPTEDDDRAAALEDLDDPGGLE